MTAPAPPAAATTPHGDLALVNGRIHTLDGAARTVACLAARDGRIIARLREKLGALTLTERPLETPDAAALTLAARSLQ